MSRIATPVGAPWCAGDQVGRLDPNDARTPGMLRQAAISHARGGSGQGTITISTVDPGRQRWTHVPGLNTDRRQACLDQASIKPRRERPRLKPDPADPVSHAEETSLIALSRRLEGSLRPRATSPLLWATGRLLRYYGGHRAATTHRHDHAVGSQGAWSKSSVRSLATHLSRPHLEGMACLLTHRSLTIRLPRAVQFRG
jgi:hypothetical protein